MQAVFVSEIVRNCETEEKLTKPRISEIICCGPFILTGNTEMLGGLLAKGMTSHNRKYMIFSFFLMVGDIGLGPMSERENQKKMTQENKKNN